MPLRIPAIDLLGLTTTFGNVSVTQATANALTLLEHSGVDIPVARGVDVPMVQALRPFPTFVHGADGLGEQFLPPPESKSAAISAAEFIVDTTMRWPGEVTLVAIGPLGNLASALALEPALFRRVAAANGRVGPLREAAAEFYIRFHERVTGERVCRGHDVAAVAAVAESGLFESRSGRVCVVTDGPAKGQTVFAPDGHRYGAQWDQGSTVKLVKGIAAAAVLDSFEKQLSGSFWPGGQR